jgi:hypothetical protein
MPIETVPHQLCNTWCEANVRLTFPTGDRPKCMVVS